MDDMEVSSSENGPTQRSLKMLMEFHGKSPMENLDDQMGVPPFSALESPQPLGWLCDGEATTKRDARHVGSQHAGVEA